MLTDEAYRLALGVYLGCGGLALIVLLWWLRNATPRWLRIWLGFTLAALLLTPALVQPGAATLAPALVVAAFQLLTADVEAAMHALRPLALTTGLAWLLALVLALLWRPRVTPSP